MEEFDGLNMKRGFAMILDAVVALTFTLLIFTALVSVRFGAGSSPDMSVKRLHYLSEDTLDVLNKKGVLDQIGEDWAAAGGNQSSPHFQSANLTAYRNISALLPPNVGYMLTVDGDVIASSDRMPASSSETLTHSTRLLVGYGRGLPTRGNVARAFLTNIKDKVTSSYAYFGGFVGQGNITVKVRDLPAGANVQDCCLELNAQAPFTLLMNSHEIRTFSPPYDEMGANIRDVSESGCTYGGNAIPGCFGTDCKQWALPGQDNIFELKFLTGNISSQYVGGGFIHVLYNTSEMDTDRVVKTSRYYFPGIDGVINLYDSMYVPGQVLSLSGNIVLQSNYSTYLRLGDVDVFNFSGGNPTERTVALSESYMDGLGFIKTVGDPRSISENTVPIRFGTGNISASSVLDIALVNDRSGSMRQSGWTMGYNGTSALNFTSINVPAAGWSAVSAFSVDGPTKPCTVLTLEAENYSLRINSSFSTHKWVLNTSVGGYLGGGYMYVLPNSGTTNNPPDYVTRSPELRYNVTIPEAGTYYVWVRGYAASASDDSVHVGVDYASNRNSENLSNFGTGSWRWSNTRMDGGVANMTLTEGRHVLDVWMREDGFLLDKLVLTNDPAYTPAAGTCANNLNGSLAVAVNWGRLAGYSGSEASEFVLNVQRPDGTWIFEYPGSPNLAGNVVDPGNGAVGGANEYYSGISTKPQTLQVDYPQKGTWHLAVYGWNMRPKTGPPSSMAVNASVYLDMFNNSSDDMSRSATIISLDASKAATKSFIDGMEPKDRASYVVFGSYGAVLQNLTFNKTLLRAAVDNTGTEGGTYIHYGIDNGSRELVSHTRANVTRVMILLTDGQNDVSPQNVLNSAAAAKGNGTIIFTIGLTAYVNHDLLAQVATKPEYYFYTPDGSGLNSIYSRISQVITSDYRMQSVNISGSFTNSRLSPESYLEFNYIPLNQSSYGEVSLKRSTCRFDDPIDCTGSVDVLTGVVVSDARVTSYSGPYWTNYLRLANHASPAYQYLLSGWGASYLNLGDPFVIHIPPQDMESGANNTVQILTGYASGDYVGCSRDDRAIYTLRMHTLAGYGDVFERNEGCIWTIEFEDGSAFSANIPAAYSGTNECFYTNAKQSYQKRTYTPNDAVADAVWRLMNQLDLDHDGRVDLLFDTEMINMELSQASGVQSLWGPAQFKLIVWM
jgi:hypothetical protein